MPSYTDGLDRAILILCWIGAVFMLIGLNSIYRAMKMYERPRLLLITLISLVIAPVAVLFSMFPFVYSTANLVAQDVFNASFWRAEIASGILALRVTTYILTFQLLKWFSQFAIRRSQLVRARRTRGLNHDDVADFTANNTREDARLWQRSDLSSLNVSQFAFYLVVVTALWICAINEINSLSATLASWAIFFIVDDAVVIAEYSDTFHVTPLMSHMAKVLCFDLLLLIFVPAALHSSSIGALSSILTLAMIFCVVAVAGFAWRLKHFGFTKNV